jgi:hypothetical protein
MGFGEQVNRMNLQEFRPGIRSRAELGDRVVMACMEIGPGREDAGHQHPFEQCGIVKPRRFCLIIVLMSIVLLSNPAIAQRDSDNPISTVTDSKKVSLPAAPQMLHSFLRELGRVNEFEVKIFEGVQDREVVGDIGKAPLNELYGYLKRLSLNNMAMVFDTDQKNFTLYVLPEGKSISAVKEESAGPEAVSLKVFKQEISSPTQSLELKVNETVKIEVTIKNIGDEPWPIKSSDDKGTNRVNLGLQWLDGNGRKIHEDRGPLPSAIMPASSITLDVNVRALPKPGDYTLYVSMVQEHVAWFYQKGAAPLIVEVKIEG